MQLNNGEEKSQMFNILYPDDGVVDGSEFLRLSVSGKAVVSTPNESREVSFSFADLVDRAVVTVRDQSLITGGG